MKTRILLTVGDINGIGPEIILKTLAISSITKKYDLTVVAPLSALEYYYRLLVHDSFESLTRGGIKPPGGSFKIISVCEGKSLVRPGKITKETVFSPGR